MRVVLQRVSQAKVEVDNKIVSQIGTGLLVYLGVGAGDQVSDAEYIAQKLVNLRIFADQAGKMNKSVMDVKGDVLLISNFTLQADCRKGRRPGFDAAGEPELAKQLYEKTANLIAQQGVKVEKGIFAAYMLVSSINDGPGTFIVDSKC